MKNFTYNIIDLFAGAGGLSNGFEQTNRFKVIAAVELNDAAQSTFIKNHNNNPNIILKTSDTGESDITKIDFTQLKLIPEQTVVVGGPPCQGFSNANRQKNYLISGNNQLVKEYVRAIKEIEPVAFLMENVRSMNSSVHKFFVTKSSSSDENDFSSIKHLNKISTKKTPIYKRDTIDLLASKNMLIINLLYNFSALSEVPKPIVSNPTYLSFLRTLQRRFEKDGMLYINKTKEFANIESILESIKNDTFRTDKELEFILSVKNSLIYLLKGRLDSKELLQPLILFNEYNNFLVRCQELKDENIECMKLNTVRDKNDYFIIQAEVYSYNIVEYLYHIFTYYGYKVSSDVLDSSNFGVPQKRKRFIMIGIKSNKSELSLPKNVNKTLYTVEDAIKDLENIEPQKDVIHYNNQIYNVDNNSLKSFELLHYYRKHLEGSKILYNHINTNSTPLIQTRYNEIREKKGKNFHSLSDDLKSSYKDAKRTQNTVYLRLDYNEPSPTVVNVRKSMWQHPTKARALSIREAARLQSFQDSYVFYGRKDEQYQQVGNAVPPLLAKALAQHILNLLD
ncbi:DNA cytosine methyltransferase [Exiguobacterium sp. E4787]|uniref:DNA cytosine methyltransferase n=1 Tax=Exiguobacterium sp. E4787 TaxID=2751225 RepID=UPI001BEADBBA|nr:DNA cytosine methyltransferase [Exiguobacterium sp. E4787]